VKKAKEELD